MFQIWKEREKAKILKNKEQKKNLFVKGHISLDQFLKIAQSKYGHWSDEELINYKMSHGHCVKSKY